MDSLLPSLSAAKNRRKGDAAAGRKRSRGKTGKSNNADDAAPTLSLKSKIKALHDWYDRCAVRRLDQRKKELRNTRVHEDRTLQWLRTHAPRRWRVKVRDRNRRMEAREWFDSLDFDGSGEISVAELKQPLIAMGFAGSVQEVRDLVESVDDDGSGEIGFEEFLSILGGGGSGGGGGGVHAGGVGGTSSGKKKGGSRPSTSLSSASVNSAKSSSSRTSLSSGNGGAIRKLHRMLEAGQLGDTEHLELETLLVSYQRSVLTGALFSRGFRAAQSGIGTREKLEHQRTVNALYESFLADEAARKIEEDQKKRLERKRAQQEKRKQRKKHSTSGGGMDVLATMLAAAKEEEKDDEGADNDDAANTKEDASALGAPPHTHHKHNRNTHNYIPKGKRLGHGTSIAEINRRAARASQHIHKLGDMRDRNRDEFMIQRTKEDTANFSLHAPWTRAYCGLDTRAPGMSKEERLQILRDELRASRAAMRDSIPVGRNKALHKLLVGRPLSTTSFVPDRKERELVPVKVPVNSAFLMAKRAKLLGTGTPKVVKGSRLNVRLRRFRERGVKELR